MNLNSLRRSSLATAMCAAPILFTTSCKPDEIGDPRTAAPTVSVTFPQPASHATRSFTGTIVARVQSSVGFRVTGKITERLVNAGQRVSKGQVLMKLDPVDLDLAAAANASNATALRAIYVQTQADERRMAELLKTSAVSVQDYDAAKAAYERAQAQLAAAEAQSEVSENQKKYTFLQADADGVILETLAEPGQVVAAGQVVVRLAHDGPREAEIDLPEDVRPSIGSEAIAIIYGNNQEMTSTLRQLSEAADPASRTFEARYVLSEKSANIPVGSTVMIRMRLGDEQAAAGSVNVPAAAIFDRGEGPAIWILSEGNKVMQRAVKIERIGDDKITLAAGPKSGEQIISLGAHLLHEGQKVQPQP